VYHAFLLEKDCVFEAVDLNLSNLDLIPMLYDWTILFIAVKIYEPKVHINQNLENMNL